MHCPKCQFDHPLQTTECLKCGIVFSRYQPPLDPIAIPTVPAVPPFLAFQSSPVDRSAAERELKYRASPFPWHSYSRACSVAPICVSPPPCSPWSSMKVATPSPLGSPDAGPCLCSGSPSTEKNVPGRLSLFCQPPSSSSAFIPGKPGAGVGSLPPPCCSFSRSSPCLCLREP